jgi:hypothetical protein
MSKNECPLPTPHSLGSVGTKWNEVLSGTLINFTWFFSQFYRSVILMVRRLDPAAAERESKLELALAGLADGTYTSIDHAVSVLRVPKTTLFRRVHGGKTRNEAAEWRQLVTKHKEKALAQWISTSTVSGHPILYAKARDYVTQIYNMGNYVG